MKRRNWTREELILAFNLYLKIPFGKMHKSNPDIIKLAQLMERTPSSIAMRLTNFSSVDPFHQKRGVVGLKGGIKQCKPIWDEFIDNKEELLYESEKILAEYENQTIELKYSDLLKDTKKYKGEIKLREVKTRVNQTIFRQIVLINYSTNCAICGIDIPELLVASHIIPWAQNSKERLNPENGICLSSLYDTAFDKGFIGISKDYKLLISNKLKENSTKDYYNKYFGLIENQKIQIPIKYEPKKEFLEYHLDTIFLK